MYVGSSKNWLKNEAIFINVSVTMHLNPITQVPRLFYFEIITKVRIVFIYEEIRIVLKPNSTARLYDLDSRTTKFHIIL